MVLQMERELSAFFELHKIMTSQLSNVSFEHNIKSQLWCSIIRPCYENYQSKSH